MKYLIFFLISDLKTIKVIIKKFFFLPYFYFFVYLFDKKNKIFSSKNY
jgi:hypothetical protein